MNLVEKLPDFCDLIKITILCTSRKEFQAKTHKKVLIPDIEEVLNWLGDREEGAGPPLVLVGQLLRVHEVAVAVRHRLASQVPQLTHLNRGANKNRVPTPSTPLPLSALKRVKYAPLPHWERQAM
jgi:hypothetical protein